MKKKANNITPLTIVIILVTVLVCIMLYSKVKEELYIKEMKQQAQKHINILFDYYDANGIMPSVYCTCDESIMYVKESDSNFSIYFLLGFDESMTYHSNTKCWNIE